MRNGGSASNGPVGYFAMTATATKVITNSAATPNSYIYLTPYNASGGALMGGAKSLYISVFGTGSFTVATADASNAAGTEGIQYLIIN